jgi:fido (protein-threonine AMPylation protein)/predicted transcriptional regulator of viral defense system
MAKVFQQALAESLQRVHDIADNGIVRADQLLRADRERLEKSGWLTRVMKGWYLFAQPQLHEGESTRWYASFWLFLSIYLKTRFSKAYCLSAVDSLHVALGETQMPKQVLIMTKTAGNMRIDLPFNTSLMIYQESNTFPETVEKMQGLNIMPVAKAIMRAPVKYFQNDPKQMEIALSTVDIHALSKELLSAKNLSAAERIVGGYQSMNQPKIAKELTDMMQAAGYSIKPTNPFLKAKPALGIARIKSPYSARIKILWQNYREDILAMAPQVIGLPRAKKRYLAAVDALYLQDAYHSLSIEGYRVTEQLINDIAKGHWRPDQYHNHAEQRNALAARGYYLAFQAVRKSMQAILAKENPGQVVKNNLSRWHQQLFSPSVQSGIIGAERLAGYRDGQVYIRGSMHTPFPQQALTDAMDTFFDCLIAEKNAMVRAVLGHFMFVYIHPYMDGNGRLARFLMNTMLASGGFLWAVIHVDRRKQYFTALEKASAGGDIKPFARFVLSEIVP